MTYAYEVVDSHRGVEKTAIIRLVDSTTVEIDALAGHVVDSSAWTFSDASVRFAR